MTALARHLLALSATCLIAGCTSGPPPGFSKGDAWTFPLVGPLEGSLLITPVTIGDKGPYLFLIDPDASVSSLDERLADDLDLYQRLGPRLFDEADVSRPTRVAEVLAMTVGTLTVKNRVVTLHAAGAYAADGRDIVGVLGRDVIADSLVFGFDRDAGMAYLATREAFTAPAGAVRVAYTHEVSREGADIAPVGTGPTGTVPRRIASATINGAPAKLHLDLGAVSSQLTPAKWKAARLAPVPYKAVTIDEVAVTRTVEKAGIANRVEAGAAGAMGLVMIPFADKRFDEQDVDGSLGLNFFAAYVVWANWDERAFYLSPRDGENDGVSARVARWDAPVLTGCKQPACAAARLESIEVEAAPGAATPTPPAMPADTVEPAAEAPTLVVTRDSEVATLGYELLLEAVGADGRALGLPRLAATFAPGTREIRQRLSPVFAGARFRVLDVSPFVRSCPSADGCVFELVPAR